MGAVYRATDSRDVAIKVLPEVFAQDTGRMARFEREAGHWLEYVSDESGRAEISVRPFPGPGGKWQISSGGGGSPVWSRTTAELLFRGADGRVMTVHYTAKGDSFHARTPEVWTEAKVGGFQRSTARSRRSTARLSATRSRSGGVPASRIGAGTAAGAHRPPLGGLHPYRYERRHRGCPVRQVPNGGRKSSDFHV
jgi:hypothetical protein